MYVQVGESRREAIHEFALQVQAGLLHFRGSEIWRKCRNVAGNPVRDGSRWRAVHAVQRATYQRIRIGREYLVVEKLGIIEKKI